MKKLLYSLILIAGSCFSHSAFSQGMTPVALSGFTNDYIANGAAGWQGGATVSPGTCFDNPTALAYNYVSDDYPAAVDGLPANGKITSLVTPTVNYQLANYNANNVLQVHTASLSGTLNFVYAQAASEVYILASTGSGTSTNTITFTFTDNTTEVFTNITYPDWFTQPITPATKKYNRVSNSGGIDGGPSGNGALLFEFKFTLSAGNINKPIASVNFTRTAFTSTHGALGVFAISINATGAPQGGFPPLANFDFKDTDTLWINSPATLFNTSTGRDKSYWNIVGYNPGSKAGPWSTVNAGRVSYPFGPVMDSSTNFKYSFPNAGYYLLKLVVTNSAGSNSIEKTVYVAEPSVKPRAIWFSDKTEAGKYGEISFYDQSTNGPVSWKWSIDPPCYNCASVFQNQFSNEYAANPVLATNEPGVYTVCLEVANSKGKDSLCRKQYINIKQGYQICSGELNNKASDFEGYLSSGGLFTPGQPYYYTAPNCSYGFMIAPCADTIVVTLERLRLRSSDSVFVRSGSISGPKLMRFGGNTTTAPKILKYVGLQLFVTFEGPSSTTAIQDSGFTLKWTSTPATYPKPKAGFIIPDTIYSGYSLNPKSTSTGNKMIYAWDINGDNVFGLDNSSLGIDSIVENPTNIVFSTLVDVQRTMRLKVSNCRGSDTVSKKIWVLPISEKPLANFTVDKVNGVYATDTFTFTDRSLKGATEWQWSFIPSNVTFIMGTSATSQNPMVLLTAAQSYHVKLIAKNTKGIDSNTKFNYVTAFAYEVPNSIDAPNNVATDIGISRVRSGTIDTITPAKTPVYTPLQALQKNTVYRGATYQISVYRPTALDSQSMRIWIDYNRNTLFGDQTNEVILSENDQRKLVTSASYKIPDNAPMGTTRMRVAVAATPVSHLTPTLAGVGVFEDYAIEVAQDTVKPILKLMEPAVLKVEVNKTFPEPGYTASDNIEGDITINVQRTGLLDMTRVGYYTLKYTVTDLYGNVSDTAVRLVQVEINQTGPQISLTGADTITAEVFGTFTDPGYSAVDNTGEDITSLVTKISTLDMKQVGNYHVIYKVTDAFGFSTQKVRVIRVKDTQKPWVRTHKNPAKISGDTVIHQRGSTFSDMSYVNLNDNYWTGAQLTYTKTPASFDVNVTGIHTVRYTASDASGNISDEYVLYVSVRDIIAPEITLKGASPLNIEVFGTTTDPGATVSDNLTSPGKLTVTSDWNNVVKSNIVNTTTGYTVTYSSIDEDGNTGYAKRQVFVVDTKAPSIKMIGKNPLILPRGVSYADNDPGYQVTDNYTSPSNIIIEIDSSAMNTHEAGNSFYIYYMAIDQAGNRSERAFRKVDIRAWQTGIEEEKDHSAVTLYPNPGSGTLHIETSMNDITGIRITNILGETVIDKATQEMHTELNITGLNDGLYFATVTGKTGTTTTRFMVKK